MAVAAVPFLAFFFAFGYFKANDAILKVSAQVKRVEVDWKALAVHVCFMLAFLALSALSMRTRFSGPVSALVSASWFACGLLGIASAACAFLRPHWWMMFFRATGSLWIWSALAAAVAWKLIPVLRSAWRIPFFRPLTNLTFHFVEILLRPFVSVVSQPMYLTIGTAKFSVRIADQCSGLEGAGLMLIFGAVWLGLFRRECRFPQALLLIPASITVLWILNAVRIVILILIGNAGAPEIALGGFHSQAGWISFNLVAIGVALMAGRIPWWSRRREEAPVEAAGDNPSAAYLAPFLAILAAAMVSRALSAGFEWLYPLRFIGAAAALWFFRAQYKKLDWRFGWQAPATGVAVYFLWIGLDALHGPGAASTMGSTLAASSGLVRVSWIAIRIAAAVVTVPIAEELAFRGFLIRRLMRADFESLDVRRFTWLALLVSSVAFGVLHGDRWIAGALAGLVYAAAMLRRGRIGEAVVAHATTNALIGLTVLTAGKWYLW